MRQLASLLVLALYSTAAARADKLVRVAGGGTEEQGKPASQCKLIEPFGVGFDKAGNTYIIEMGGGRLLKMDDKGVLAILAGTANKKGDAGDGGPAAKALFNGPHSLAVAANGDIYVADTWNNRVRKIDVKTGAIATIAGTGQKGFAGDGGPAVKAQFGGIYCVALDAKEQNLYLADLDNKRIRKIDLAGGVVTSVAGNGKAGVPEDGATATDAPLLDPRAVAVDAKGNIYVLERSGHALRVVDPSGKIRTVAGTGKAGNSGDGGDARKAMLNGPKHLCVDADGNLLIADSENHVIRKYLPADGKIVRVAGTGKKGSAGIDGPPEKAELDRPHGVSIHASGAIYIADSENHRVVRIDK
jgi:DNA-binding beta-propeller fold protein YncE